VPLLLDKQIMSNPSDAGFSSGFPVQCVTLVTAMPNKPADNIDSEHSKSQAENVLQLKSVYIRQGDGMRSLRDVFNPLFSGIPKGGIHG